MHTRKRVLKIMLLGIIIIFFTFKLETINSVNDISKLNKITIYDKNDEIIYEENNSHQANYVKLIDINPRFIRYLLTIEDKNFYKHPGFDPVRIIKVFFTNIVSKEKKGASTITQQYVKNLYLSNHKSYIRKLKEIYYAVKLENIYTKDEILEGYLNTIYFASNIYGIYDASYYYFNKHPKNLSINESALLIAMIKAPNTYSPLLNYEASMKRKNEILAILLKNKEISETEYQTSVAQNIEIHGIHKQSYSSAIMFFKDHVLQEFYELGLKLDFGKNYNIYTSYDQALNERLNTYINRNLDDCNSSVVIMDKQGYLVSCIGGNNYYESAYNIAYKAKRDIGSTIKPLLYYCALENGFTPLTTFTSEKSDFYLKNEKISFSNYHDIYENKKITMAYALATSDNIYAVKTHLFLRMKPLVALLKKFGIQSEEKPTLALGNVAMSLLDLTSIYHTLSTQGNYLKPHSIKTIADQNKKIYTTKSIPVRKLDSTICYQISELMTLMFDTRLNNIMHVTGTSLAPKITNMVAGKSGLTDFDSYMMSFNPYYTIGVWCGYTDNRELTSTYLQGMPKKIFYEAYDQLIKGNEEIWYECPSNITKRLVDPTAFNIGYKINLPFQKNK